MNFASFQNRPKISPRALRVHVAGIGMGFGAAGSGYAFFNETTGKKAIKWVDGLSRNEAQYRSLLFAVQNMPPDSEAEVLSSSKLLIREFRRDYSYRKPELEDILSRVYMTNGEGRLTITLSWIPREQNLADRLLRRRAK